MKIIIPASGSGQRFIDAGYKENKPLIKVNEHKRIIDYVLNIFDIENDEFYFILSNSNIEKFKSFLALSKVKNYKILLEKGPKLGPVGAIIDTYSELSKYIKKDDDVIISYCDFGMDWNYNKFLRYAAKSEYDAIMPTYYGYHPHLGKPENVYACALCERDNEIIEVKEKFKTKNKEDHYWSPGVYYFKTFEIMKNSFNLLIEADDKVNNEFYVSLAYNYLENKSVSYPYVEHFYQFGIPVDFEYAKTKLNLLRKINETTEIDDKIDNLILLGAGRGERFLNLGWNIPKPFLPINNNDIITTSLKSFDNNYKKLRLIGAKDHSLYWKNSSLFKDTKLIPPNKKGAAYSYIEGTRDIKGSVLIAPCDLVANHINEEFKEKYKKHDAIVFVSEPTEYSLKNPNSFAWVLEENDKVEISIKKPFENRELKTQKLLIGSFYVNNQELLKLAIIYIFYHQLKTNGEYYLDNAFKYLSEFYNVATVNVNDYFSLGTPEEYNENKYWLES